MTRRTKFLITALFLCHQLPIPALVTRELLAQDTGQSGQVAGQAGRQKAASKEKRAAAEENTPCGTQAASQDAEETTICAVEQEKNGDIYNLRGNAEIHYRGYILRADEVTYDSDSGEASGSGHFRLDGGPEDVHLKATHGNYNLVSETGRFYDVTATTGLRFQGKEVVLTSTSPFAFTGKRVEKTTSDRYVVYDGTITTCELPHPAWRFDAHKLVVDVGGNAFIYHSWFMLHGFPIFYFPYATHPVERETRHTGFLIPTIGQSSIKGTIVGEGVYWDINRTMDAEMGAEYFSKRGWSQKGEFRARPSDTSYVDLNYFGVMDRGIPIAVAPAFVNPTGEGLLREGGEEARLLGAGNFFGFRSVANIDYLSSFLFRLAFNEIFTQAVNSEVKSQAFLSRPVNGLFLSGMVERYQDFFQTAVNGVLSNPPSFDSVRILHVPSFDASSVDLPLGHSPVFWSFDASVAGLTRGEPGFGTGTLLGRFDLSPEISMPVHFWQWSLRPAIALHDTYYTERFVNGAAVNDPTNRQAVEASVELRPPVLEKIFDKEFLGRKWKHVIEPRAVYRMVTGVNDSANVLHFDERDILSNTHEVEYGFVTRLYAKHTAPHPPECATPMTGLAVGAAAPEQIVPWQYADNLENQSCPQGPEAKEIVTWELTQKYFLDPNFGGALISGQRNVFTTTEDLTGIAFLIEPRHLSPLVSRLRAATSSHTDTEWDLDYDFQLGRINASTLLVNYYVGPFTIGGGDAFLQIPQTVTSPPAQSEGTCGPTETGQVTCKFQQFRVALGYGALNRRGFSAATSFGYDSEVRKLQFATAQTTYNWDCCGLTLEYRRYAIANVRNENLFRFTFTLANIATFGNLRRQERLY